MCFTVHESATPAVSAAPAIDWEEPDCLLCGGRDTSPVLEAPDPMSSSRNCLFTVVRCQACGLCFTSPRPSPQSIGQFYPGTYGPHRGSHLRPIPWRTRWFGLPREPRKEHDLFAWHGQGRLLDFGCGVGGFLDQMKRHGWRVAGIDVSRAAVECVRSELGIPAWEGTLPHVELRPASFDVVTMWHALEHVHDPLAVLREAHRLLDCGGKLLVAVPNIDSLPFRWFGAGWFGLELPRHLTHFTPRTLQQMLEQAGFRVGAVRMVRHSDWLWTAARRAEKKGLAGPGWQRWLTVKSVSRLVTAYSWLTGQCDCLIVSAYR